MITAKEAYDAIDPATPEPQRREYAERLIASSAAFDSYLDSRPQLEQIIAQATGAGRIPSHDELNGSPDAAQVAAGDGTAVASSEVAAAPAIGTPLPPADQVGTAPVTDAQVVGDGTAAAPSGVVALSTESEKPDSDKDDAELEAEIDALKERVSTLEAQKEGKA